MCLFSIYSWLRQVHRGIRWLRGWSCRGWSCFPHFLMEVPGKAWSPGPSVPYSENGPTVQALRSLRVKRLPFACCISIVHIFLMSLLYPRGCSSVVPFKAITAAVWSCRGWLMILKEMVKFAKLQIPPEVFGPDWPNTRGTCVTRVKEIPPWLRQCKMLLSHQ